MTGHTDGNKTDSATRALAVHMCAMPPLRRGTISGQHAWLVNSCSIYDTTLDERQSADAASHYVTVCGVQPYVCVLIQHPRVSAPDSAPIGARFHN